jgi:hypothetical protein
MSGGLSVRSMSVRRLRYTTNNFQVNAARGQVYRMQFARRMRMTSVR